MESSRKRKNHQSNDVSPSKIGKKALTSTERVRLHRARQLIMEYPLSSSRVNISSTNSITVMMNKRTPSSTQDRMRHRGKELIDGNSSLSTQINSFGTGANTTKKKAMTSSERGRLYRERQRIVEQGLLNEAISAPSTSKGTNMKDSGANKKATNAVQTTQETSGTVQFPWKKLISHKSTHKICEKQLSNDGFGDVCYAYACFWFENDWKIFSHKTKRPARTVNLLRAFQNWSNSDLITQQEDKLSNMNDFTLYSFNCQSLRAHFSDQHDRVLQSSTFLLFSESCIRHEEHIDISNSYCVTQCKRPNTTAGGVAAYHSSTDTLDNKTIKQDIAPTGLLQISDPIAQIDDMAVVRCANINEKTLIIVVLYISPNKTVSSIVKFIHRQLLHFTSEGSNLLNSDYHELPMILTGDFAVDFCSKESQTLIDFLREKLNLTINNSPVQSKTRYGTKIDIVFSRNLEKLQSRVHVSHFSHHKPINLFLDQ